LGPANAAAVVNVTRTIVAALKIVETVRDYLRVDSEFLALPGTTWGRVPEPDMHQ
jgi:hypothetical protein